MRVERDPPPLANALPGWPPEIKPMSALAAALQQTAQLQSKLDGNKGPNKNTPACQGLVNALKL